MATKFLALAKRTEWEERAERHARERYRERMGLDRTPAQKLAEARAHQGAAGTIRRG